MAFIVRFGSFTFCILQKSLCVLLCEARKEKRFTSGSDVDACWCGLGVLHRDNEVFDALARRHLADVLHPPLIDIDIGIKRRLR